MGKTYALSRIKKNFFFEDVTKNKEEELYTAMMT